jgi:protoporphyrinogen oxidase
MNKPHKSVDGASPSERTVIIGGGPAGLTAAYNLCKKGIKCVVLEKDHVVGGLSRTVSYNGYHFDIGGHRFFTKVKAVEDIWREVLGKNFLRRNRLSRIYYDGKFFNYPLRPLNALMGLGLWNSIFILMSYAYAQLVPGKTEDSFEQWVSNRFGKRLYQIFFKNYTEKVWGIPCSEISAEWAAQRIKGLTLVTALKDSLIKQRNKNKTDVIKTLIDEFDYPKRGPGMMWEATADIINCEGGQVQMDSLVQKVFWNNHRVEALEIKVNGQKEVIEGTHFISSMALRDLIESFEPSVPDNVLTAAKKLNYRDFLTVALIINKGDLFPDNWIYIHDPSVKVGRIQNYKNWSPFMVPDPNKSCVGLEYFCFEGDGLWTMADQELVGLGKKELETLKFIRAADVEDGAVVRMPKAYPVYDPEYLEALKIVREFINGIDNLQLVGRNGMHRYNNQDHSMLTAMLAAENILGANHDLWEVNAEQEYLEEIGSREEISAADRAVIKAFSRIDKLGFATGIGTVSGLLVFLATLWLNFTGGEVIAPSIHFLNQYFFGYSVTVKGAFVGMSYSFVWGFLFGWLSAYLRNLFVAFYMYQVKRKLELLSFRDFLDNF